MPTYYKISVSFKFCKLSNGDKLEIANFYALCVSCHSPANILRNIQTCARFSSILSIAIAIAVAVAAAYDRHPVTVYKRASRGLAQLKQRKQRNLAFELEVILISS